ncbi:Major latex protein domain containing protein [Quillaja saponaria]|uniref:Major latex protein domain containing protein n=1 Tax=Quillaja saponaria TaxID=32244 RepID=A0AAD7KN83_QUISA|nr:Major latex protein domain containing protein [Quillaja saponaria]
MSLVGKLEADIEIKTPAEKFYNLLKSQNHQVPNASSDKVHSVEVHEEGNLEVFKERVEVDEENKTVSLTAVEGHVLDLYKKYKVNFKVTPKTSEGGLMKITVEYEKKNYSIPDPNKYLQFVIHVVQDIDSQLIKA